MRIPVLFPSAPVLVLVSGLLPAAPEGRMSLPGGFRQEVLLDLDLSRPFELALTALCYAPDGEPVVYESGKVQRLRGDGSSALLAEFQPAVFGSFLVLSPGGESALFGESSFGNIHEVSLDGSGSRLVGTLGGNYDLAFAPAGAPEGLRDRAFVSAPGTSGDNSIFILSGDAPVPPDELIAGAGAYSGPLSFDDAGNLYYVTAGTMDPPALVRFTPEQLASGTGEGALSFTAGETVLSDLDGASDLEWHRGRLFLTNLGFTSGFGTIEVIDARQNFLRSTFATLPSSEGIISATHLVIHPGVDDFAAGAGVEGGKLLVSYSDFSTVSHLVEVVPESWFVRGEVNGDAEVDLSDAIHLLAFLFSGGPAPRREEAADINRDEAVDISDAVYLLRYLFTGGPQPPAPFPEPGME